MLSFQGKSKQAKKAQKGNIHEKGIEEEYKKVPHSFVFSRGKPVGKFSNELITDIRRVMLPYTAKSLKVINHLYYGLNQSHNILLDMLYNSSLKESCQSK